MNLRILGALIASSLSTSLLLTNAISAQTTTVRATTLVKGSGTAVYYVSNDGKRYAFPDSTTYYSWFPDFSTVQTITDSELASLPLGGLVTIRPGSNMVKIQTDPRVYAVTRGGRLRWVQTEDLARGLFGSDWNRRVKDVPDAFFASYQTGLVIDEASDFPEVTTDMTVPNLETDLFTRFPPQISPTAPTASSTPTTPTISTPTTPTSTSATPPTATSTSAIAGRLQVLTNGTVNSGDTVTVLATVTRGFADRITISFGTSTRRSTCSQSPCTADFVLPNYSTTSTATFQAVFQLGEGAGLVTSTSTIDVAVSPNQVSDGITLLIPVQSIYGGSRTIRAEASPVLNVRQIRLVMDDALLYECTGRQTCEYTEQEIARGGTTHSVYAVIIDGEYRRLFSNTVQIPVVQ